MLRRVAVATLAVAVVGAGTAGVVVLSQGSDDDATSDGSVPADPSSDESVGAVGAVPGASGAGGTDPSVVAVSAEHASDTVVSPDPEVVATGVDGGPTTTAALDQHPTPSAATPATVLTLGDADAGVFATSLGTVVQATGVAVVQTDARPGSGLARPDVFDWPATMLEQVPLVRPDIVVVGFGSEDAQAITDVSGAVVVEQATGDPVADVEWRAEYARRVGAFMDLLAADGRSVIWVGVPNAVGDEFATRLRVQHEVVQGEAARRPGVTFVDTWTRFSSRDGGAATFVVDPRDGQAKAVREADGFHLSTVGAEILALDIADAIRADLVARGAVL